MAMSRSEAISFLEGLLEVLKMPTTDAPTTWIPVGDARRPADGELVVVKTKDGCKYFGSAYDGKFMKDIVAWYPLPKE